jgi:hypothetical protein
MRERAMYLPISREKDQREIAIGKIGQQRHQHYLQMDFF